MRRCLVCGAGNPDDARFCVECGSSLADLCDRCGAELPPAVHFCPACGARVVVAPVAPSEERKLVTVLFADVVGSTALGARLDPERLREVTDAYFDAMRDELEGQGGTVEKYIGDAVMAVFGVPAAHEDDPTRALRAALGMFRRLTDLNQTLESLHGVMLAMRIGVNTGEVLAVTRPRPEGRMVTGDAVNIAARLEQAAASGQILAAERTVRSARGFQFVEVGPLRLRGKDDAIRAYEVLEAAPGRERETTTQVPMIGRQGEVELLQTLFRRMVTDDRPDLVTVFGEAGIGKSRLVEEFQTWAEQLERPPTIVHGRCLPYGESMAYWPLAEILKRQAGVLDSDPPEAALSKVRTLASDLLTDGPAPNLERTVAALAMTVGLDDPGSPIRGLEPRQARLEVASAWRTFFSALARAEPAIVVLHDLHWAGPAMLDLVEELADRLETAVMFLGSARRELSAERPGWGARSRNFTSIMLEPLGPRDSERLLGFLLDGAQNEVPASVRGRILERAGGNPFFLEQIVRRLVEERTAAGAHVGTWDLEHVDIPDTVQAVLSARIDLLEPVEKWVLRSAAVVGKEFWGGPVSRLLDDEVVSGTGAVEEVLSRLEERGLIAARLSSMMEGEQEYAFRHILTRDVAYESLPRAQRSEAHARVADWIKERAGERETEFAELLSHHYAQAYRLSRDDVRRDRSEEAHYQTEGFRYALLASEQATGKLALSEAEGQAELALSLAPTPLDRSKALEALGDASLLDSDGDRAWQCLKEAVDIRREADPTDAREIARLCAKALEVPTRTRGSMRARPPRDEAAPYLELGMENSGPDDSEELARLLIVKAFWPASLGEGRGTEQEELEAKKSGEQAAAMAMRLGRPDLASSALDGVGQFFQDRGLYGPWNRLVQRRLDLAHSLSDPGELGDIYAMGAWCAYHIGRYRDAEHYADRGVEATLATAPNWALYCLDWRAVARCRLGEWEALFGDAFLIADLLGDRQGQPPGFASDHLGSAAFVHEIRGDAADADRILEVVRWLEREEERPSAGLAVWKSLFLARRGAFDEARAALDLPHTLWHGYARGIVLEARCEIAAQQEAWDEVPELLHASWTHAQEAELLALPCYADRLEGLAARAGGDRERASELLHRALTGFTELDARWEAARTALALAGVHADEGRAEAARELLADARPVVDRLRCVLESSVAEDLAVRLG
ncbi:MAG TPA: adenylate/guanylate cyclase domain-containing protein [Actinomycetota bacterium]|nr:adenylate/guanylate cyclase domain-containing protein [Actinomycetota bacterium]